MTFGERIKTERMRQRMSQKGLATLAQVSPQYLGDIEHDRRGAPSDDVIDRLAAALGCSADLVYFWAGRLPPQLRDTDADHNAILDGLALLYGAVGSGGR
jgi:transcriptional regulator with XRE-family HTH domain